MHQSGEIEVWQALHIFSEMVQVEIKCPIIFLIGFSTDHLVCIRFNVCYLILALTTAKISRVVQRSILSLQFSFRSPFWIAGTRYFIV